MAWKLERMPYSVDPWRIVAVEDDGREREVFVRGRDWRPEFEGRPIWEPLAFPTKSAAVDWLLRMAEAHHTLDVPRPQVPGQTSIDDHAEAT